jgi:hypothetical protein
MARPHRGGVNVLIFPDSAFKPRSGTFRLEHLHCCRHRVRRLACTTASRCSCFSVPAIAITKKSKMDPSTATAAAEDVANGRIEQNTPATARRTGTQRSLPTGPTLRRIAVAPTHTASISTTSVPGIVRLDSKIRARLQFDRCHRAQHQYRRSDLAPLIKIDHEFINMGSPTTRNIRAWADLCRE